MNTEITITIRNSSVYVKTESGESGQSHGLPREALQALREVAIKGWGVSPQNELWREAWRDLAMALDRLDAMDARCCVGVSDSANAEVSHRDRERQPAADQTPKQP